MQNTIKYLKNDYIQLNNIIYRPYKVCAIPTNFGFIYNEETEREGINEWFNHRGYTYIIDRVAK